MDRLPSYFEDFFLGPGDAVGFDCPPLASQLVRTAEQRLGVKLPAAYLLLLGIQNGGYVTRPICSVDERNSWAEDHVHFDHLFGIGGRDGIDSETGSRFLISKWGYPDIGVVINSSGRRAVLLDYSESGPQGEPRVVWVDVEARGGTQVIELAPSFEEFISRLESY